MFILLKKLSFIIFSGYITFYNPVGRTLACPKVLGEPKWKWKYRGRREGIAHRWLPCGTTVYIKLGERKVKTKVIDRGPYGATSPEGKRYVATPRFLKKWWREKYAREGKKLSEQEARRLSMVLPPGWKWRCIADVLYSLKKKLKTKGGRQPGALIIDGSTWEKVRSLQPENDSFLTATATTQDQS